MNSKPCLFCNKVEEIKYLQKIKKINSGYICISFDKNGNIKCIQSIKAINMKNPKEKVIKILNEVIKILKDED